MVKAEGSCPRPHPVASQQPDLNCIRTLLEPRSPCFPGYLNSCTCMLPAHSAMLGYAGLHLPIPEKEQANEAHELLPTCFQTPYLNSKPCFREIHHGLSDKTTVKATQTMNSGSVQKKLLIFDHSGSKTRLIYSPVYPLVKNPLTAAKIFAQGYNENEAGLATKMDQSDPLKYCFEEECNKNHITKEESEMHEDTDEINALLYSDDEVDDYSGDDEVTSTGHSPLAIEVSYVKQEKLDCMTEAVACSDGKSKRQKLLDGGYKRESPLYTTNSVQLDETHECVSDAESRYSDLLICAAGQTQEVDSTLGNVQLRKDKIRRTLRVLESIIPGAKGKQPLVGY
ncbi:Transcription factor [Quillaja saponaria]|uniref:Transcription factor n=1 Tax=Quillaja saponaria TaxID=32244 RepID=A0AAD7M1R7_QUISA|nr:Transcription factor [Quillaja saponaria]KAJ7968287.1 Transcription factor [Quillaja saponaria]